MRDPLGEAVNVEKTKNEWKYPFRTLYGKKNKFSKIFFAFPDEGMDHFYDGWKMTQVCLTPLWNGNFHSFFKISGVTASLVR